MEKFLAIVKGKYFFPWPSIQNGPGVFFRGFSGNSKQILAEIVSKMNILADLDRPIPELGKDFG